MNTREFTLQSLFGSRFEFEGNSVILNKIEIPIIQRDYAQGRQNAEVTRIRERFLEALFQALVEKKHITLDFVYGDISPDGILTPLDGQQRLTTLFLLHWYIAKKEKIDIKEYEFLFHFSYATRFSSRDFCRDLIGFTPDFSINQLSATIKDQSWYPYEWKNDPTIQSMLVMIDAIHIKFEGQSGLWESLVTNKNIRFYFLALSEMGLSDDLYIKMNSRGKPLTPFEHFKADFEKNILQVSERLGEEISRKFDIDWTDMLFPYRGDNNIIDDELMRYFYFISDIIAYKSGIELEKDEFNITQIIYSNENAIAEDNIRYLIQSFDCWNNTEISNYFESIFSRKEYVSGKVNIYQEEVNIFKECLENYREYSGRNRRFPLNKMLLLFSVITYLQNKEKVSEVEFRCRIRIIRNLIWNSTDEIRDDRMRTLLLESEIVMLKGIIPVSESGELGYNVRQKEEERKKLEWIFNNPGGAEELYELEDHPLLSGCISIIDLDNISNFRKFSKLFNCCNKDLISQLLLEMGDYSQLISWRHQLGACQNESVWVDMFHPTKQRSGFDNTSVILNRLLSSLELSGINDQELKKRVDSYLANRETPKDWRYYLIKYTSMRQGDFGMYYWKNKEVKNYEVIMMNTEKTLGGKNWNPFLFALSQLAEFKSVLSLGFYGAQGDKLKIKNTEYEIDCLNDKYLVIHNDRQTEYPIPQINGIDAEDRIAFGKRIINQLINPL
jgi:hypothetical protein